MRSGCNWGDVSSGCGWQAAAGDLSVGFLPRSVHWLLTSRDKQSNRDLCLRALDGWRHLLRLEKWQGSRLHGNAATWHCLHEIGRWWLEATHFKVK